MNLRPVFMCGVFATCGIMLWPNLAEACWWCRHGHRHVVATGSNTKATNPASGGNAGVADGDVLGVGGASGERSLTGGRGGGKKTDSKLTPAEVEAEVEARTEAESVLATIAVPVLKDWAISTLRARLKSGGNVHDIMGDLLPLVHGGGSPETPARDAQIDRRIAALVKSQGELADQMAEVRKKLKLDAPAAEEDSVDERIDKLSEDFDARMKKLEAAVKKLGSRGRR